MTIFLVIAGLTGSLLAFYSDLDALIVPQYHHIAARGDDVSLLDAVTLREHAVAARPDMIFEAAVTPWQRDKPLAMYMFPRGEGIEGELYLDPFNGEILATRTAGTLSQGAAGVMPFIYELHYALALGTIGTWVFGIAALLWTLDCFLGAYLTFPRGRPFFQKWKPAWGIKKTRLNFDLHRASGLWTWAILFVFAWSSVAFNLPQVYYPFTEATLGIEQHEDFPTLETPQDEPGLSWRAAHARGQELMRAEIEARGFTRHREDAMYYDPSRAEFNYYIATQFRDDGEARDWFGLSFDANSGAQKRVYLEHLPRETPGDWLTRWIVDLHMAKVWGLPYRFFVCFMGTVVAMLSITGVIIWWRKRRSRRSSARRLAAV